MHASQSQDEVTISTPGSKNSAAPTQGGAGHRVRSHASQLAFSSHLDVVLSEFEAACQSAAPPTLQDYWVRHTVTAVVDSLDQRRALLQEMIALDLEYRWKRKIATLPRDETLLGDNPAGATPRLEDYRTLLESQFGPMPAWPVSLILDECRVQRYYAELPEAGAYEQRFPEVPGLREAVEKLQAEPVPTALIFNNRPLADYELVREVARGGMGIVYEARQISLKRTVAIKMILAGQLASEEAVRRFYAEAQAAARLNHPHIVPVFEVGQDDGRHFFSMGFVDGESLSAHVSREGPMPPEEAARLVEIVSEAVDYAHQQGVVHRDLKPQNVLLAKDGRPLVTDFGLAKQRDALDGLTVSGQLIGTPSFMSPEQAQGQTDKIGPLSDVYSLGAILYHLLTGRPPFHTASMLETLKQVIERDPVSPRSLNPEVNRDLETVCLKCLEKDPAKRYASARHLAEDLRRFVEGHAILARPISRAEKAWRWCRRQPSTAALIALAALMLVIIPPALLWYEGQVTASRAEARAAQLDREITAHRLEATQQLAAARDYNATVSEVRQTIARGRPGWSQRALDRLTHAAGLTTSVRDAAELRTEAASCLLGVDVLPGPKVADGMHLGQVAFSHDATRLAAGDLFVQAGFDCRILVLDAASGDVLHRLTLFGFPQWKQGRFAPDGCRQLAFSPDGRWLAAGGRFGHIHVWDLRQTLPKAQTWRAHDEELLPLLFAPDSQRLFSACSVEKSLKAWDLQEDQFREAAHYTSEGEIDGLSLDARGNHLVLDEDPHFVTLVSAGTLKAHSREVHGGRGSVVGAPWSGMYLGGGGDKLVLLDRQFKPTSNYEDASDPSRELWSLTRVEFSRDGRWLLAVTRLDGKCTLWDTVSRKVVFNQVLEPGAMPVAALAPDGSRLAIVGDRGAQIYQIVAHRAQSLVLDRPEAALSMVWGPAISVAPPETDSTLPAVAVHGGTSNVPLLTSYTDDELAVHRPTGRIALGYDGSGDTWTLQVWQRDPGGWRRLAERQFDGVKQLGFSPDGERLWIAGTLQVWNWDFGSGSVAERFENSIETLVTGRSNLECLAVAQELLLLGTRSGELLRLDHNEGQPQRWQLKTGPLRCVALSPDERLAACGAEDGQLRLLRLPGGQSLCDLRPRDESVEAVAFSRDGKLLATGSLDRTVRLWRIREGGAEELFDLRFPAPVVDVQFRPEGCVLAIRVRNEIAVRLLDLSQLRSFLSGPKLDWSD
jgi:serine/threonine protein kinase/WD40 repeat protein